MVTLEQARQLVSLLEKDQQDEAKVLWQQCLLEEQESVYEQVGKVTRLLHDSLDAFQLDPRLADLTNTEIPDARDRLGFVITKTEEAANKTMDAVEAALPLADELNHQVASIAPQWQRLMDGEMHRQEFVNLCHSVQHLLNVVSDDTLQLHRQLTDILMAQDFQDLTGQIIRRVIELVKEVEWQLIEILSVFNVEKTVESAQDDPLEAEGPIVVSRQDVLSSQNDVDDLLSNLGF